MTWAPKKILLAVVVLISVATGGTLFYYTYIAEYEVFERPNPAVVANVAEVFERPAPAKPEDPIDIIRAEQGIVQRQSDTASLLETKSAVNDEEQALPRRISDESLTEAQDLLRLLVTDITVSQYRNRLGTKPSPPTLTFNSNMASVELADVRELIPVSTLECSFIIVVGHADSVGSESYNMRLSRRRANSVRSRLLELQEEHSICEGSSIHMVGKGERVPASGPYVDNYELEANRRAEIFFYQ